MEAKKVGKRIKAIRKDQGLTQTEFGSQIGVKGNTVTGYENGTRCPSDAVINSICLIVNVDQTWLRTGEGTMYLSTPNTENSLQRLFSDLGCNNLEIKFLDAYFGLTRKERKAFCEVIEKMFPDAISKIVGSNPLGNPFEPVFEEALPLEESAPKEMSREEIHAEVDRQLDEEKEAAENASGYGHGKSGMATG